MLFNSSSVIVGRISTALGAVLPCLVVRPLVVDLTLDTLPVQGYGLGNMHGFSTHSDCIISYLYMGVQLNTSILGLLIRIWARMYLPG